MCQIIYIFSLHRTIYSEYFIVVRLLLLSFVMEKLASASSVDPAAGDVAAKAAVLFAAQEQKEGDSSDVVPSHHHQQEQQETRKDDDDDANVVDYDTRLDQELHVVRSIRLTMVSFLQVLERARDDLVLLGNKMDRVRIASEHCRTELMKKKQQQQEQIVTKDHTGKEEQKEKGATATSKGNEIVIGKRKRDPS